MSADRPGHRGPFVVDVQRLRRRRVPFVDVERSAPLEGLEMPASAVPPGADVTVRARLEPVEEGVMAHAVVGAPWRGVCRRCDGPAAGALRAEAWELYADAPRSEDEYPLHGDQLDLALLVRDAVLLELPQSPLCRLGCEGLCPRCGADLNVAACQCGPAPRDERWAALDQLLGERPRG